MTNANTIEFMVFKRNFNLDQIAKELNRFSVNIDETKEIRDDNEKTDMDIKAKVTNIKNPCAKCGEAEAYTIWDDEGQYGRYRIGLCSDCEKLYNELQKVDQLF